jgi:predicted component of type VI protein secretion system
MRRIYNMLRINGLQRIASIRPFTEPFQNGSFSENTGLGTEHLRNRQVVADEFFTQYAAIMAIQPRSASALESILTDYFAVPVEVQQFAGN